MLGIDFNKNLTFVTIFKFMTPAWAVVLVPYYAVFGLLAYNGVATYEIDGQVIQGAAVFIDVLKKMIVQPFLFALACSMVSMICQPFAFTKGRFLLLWGLFFLKNMTGLGFWVLSIFVEPRVEYSD